MKRTDYRKIYKQHFGEIPFDEDGRTFDIHHKDGDRNNNSIENLVALSIQDHYAIHLENKDYGACSRIAARLKMTPTEISHLVSMQQQSRVENGQHHFLGGEIQRQSNSKMLDNGTHPFLSPNYQRDNAMKRVSNGTHHFIGGTIQRKNAKLQIENGTHNFVTNNPTYNRIDNNTHNFITNNPSNIKLECPHCNMIGSKSNMNRWHFENCKHKK